MPRAADPARHVEPSPYHVLAAANPADQRSHVLKHGDLFAVFDHYGDIKPGGLGEEGLYHEGTRFLSLLLLGLDDGRPLFLSSSLRDDNDQLTVALTNPDLMRGDNVVILLGAVQLILRKFLWRESLYQRMEVVNHAIDALPLRLALHFAADYADIFEVRGARRKARGTDLPAEVAADQVTLGYRGLDEVVRRTRLRFSPAPDRLTAGAARFDLCLQPREVRTFDLVVECVRPGQEAAPLSPDRARFEVESHLQRYTAWSCHARTSSRHFNTWIERATSDLHMMTTELPTGPYPYAGVPWFNTPFGRDGILTALECLWLRPGLARGVLAFLAAQQATERIPEEDAEPGKIVHEIRSGEMAQLKEMPFGRYYGSVDATPLFVLLAGAYHDRTADLDFVRSIWPNVEAALAWIEHDGDEDGDGFVEYARRTPVGLAHQGWKDSDDAIFHADGSLAEGPIALCEVQGYVHAAYLAAAGLAERLGQEARAAALRLAARVLRERFEQAFWCEDLGCYALALDGDKRPCRVRTSNAGQCLFTGIASPEHARRVARTLLGADFFSGWGVRTVASSEVRYNPMGYHLGSVWPHDNALIAMGLARTGAAAGALQLTSALFEAGRHFELQRMPELFCGFPRHAGDPPVPYPVACSPQSWSAASVFYLLQACLGLTIDAPARSVRFVEPRMPAEIDELRIHNLEVAGATVDLLLLRHGDETSVNVLRREGDLEIVVVK